MESSEARRAVVAAMSTASALDLVVDDAVVLNDSNRLVLRLLPCDVVARVAPIAYQTAGEYSLWADYRARAEIEVELVRLLAEADSPVAVLDPRVEPRVYVRDEFVIGMWTYVEAVPSEPAPGDYAHALERLHGDMRQLDVTAPHFTDRVADTERWVASRDVTPELTDADRGLLADTLESVTRSIVGRGAAEQVLHGEPHQWNLLNTKRGPLFLDFENCVRGPTEFDLAWAPGEVGEHYPNADRELLSECRGLMLAIVAAHFWRPDSQHPNSRQGRAEFLDGVRAGPPWPAIDAL
jgi:phosphotransferase family enzyme